MHEGVAAHIALFGRVAVEQAVNARQEGVPVGHAGRALNAELARMHAGKLDALLAHWGGWRGSRGSGRSRR